MQAHCAQTSATIQTNCLWARQLFHESGKMQMQWMCVLVRVANKDVDSWLEIYFISFCAWETVRLPCVRPVFTSYFQVGFATSCQPANIFASIVVDCSVFLSSTPAKWKRKNKRKESLEFSQRFDLVLICKWYEILEYGCGRCRCRRCCGCREPSVKLSMLSAPTY